MRMRLSYFIVLFSSFVWLCQPAFAGGMSSLHSLASGAVSITNTQKRSSWVPVAVLFRFNTPASGTITVERRTSANIFLLAECLLSNNLHAVWMPDADVPFNVNDVLSITSSVTNGTAEIIRKAD